mmetsp:Transcript_54203/g.74058  ORF Transcript_54203/g.74058 Transcript_54203/m.74058 type:complete len:92 (-) Transcript_54203:133-408(-)
MRRGNVAYWAMGASSIVMSASLSQSRYSSLVSASGLVGLAVVALRLLAQLRETGPSTNELRGGLAGMDGQWVAVRVVVVGSPVLLETASSS